MLLVLIASVSIFAACSSGCKTNDGNTPPSNTDTNSQVEAVARTAAIVEMSAQLATYGVMRNEPDLRPYFETAVLLINTAISRGQYDPDAISNILAKISIDARDSEIVFMTTTAALALYRISYAEAVGKRLDQNVYCKPVLVALANGISMGLNAVHTETKFNLKRK